MTKEINYEHVISSFTQEEVNVLLKAGKRCSVICGYDWKSLIHFSYRLVKAEIPELLKQGKILEIISLGCEEKGVNFAKPTDKEIVSFMLWVKDELEKIAKLEMENLSRPPKPEMVACGIDRFDKFGSLNVVYSLCEKYGWPLEYVWKMNYEDVFSLQLFGKDMNEFNEAVNNYIKRKNEIR